MQLDLFRFFRTEFTLWTFELHFTINKYKNKGNMNKEFKIKVKLPVRWG